MEDPKVTHFPALLSWGLREFMHTQLRGKACLVHSRACQAHSKACLAHSKACLAQGKAITVTPETGNLPPVTDLVSGRAQSRSVFVEIFRDTCPRHGGLWP